MTDSSRGSDSQTTMATSRTSSASDEKSDMDKSRSFSDIISYIMMGRPFVKATSKTENTTSEARIEKKHSDKSNELQQQVNPAPILFQQPPPTPSKKACRAPLSKKFAHPCTCGPSNHHKSSNMNQNNTGPLPPAAYTPPLHLYDPATRRCLPTSRIRDMLLKECRSNIPSPYSMSHQVYQGTPCYYDDLVCDARRNRCVCKPNSHLFYESNSSTFGCVPIGPSQSPDGRASCRNGYIYNTNSKECQKIFDVNDLPPTYTPGVSPTQFSFVTIILIWVLLLVLIVTAKLRKLRTTNLYRNSPNSERRSHRSSSSYRQQGHGGSASAWLHPFIAAVNSHSHTDQLRTDHAINDSGSYDTDFFLTHGTRRLNELFGPDGQFFGSQQSLNNPPPKFEEIYPTSCTEERLTILPPSNEDLPTYDEAMKLQDTVPANTIRKE